MKTLISSVILLLFTVAVQSQGINSVIEYPNINLTGTSAVEFDSVIIVISSGNGVLIASKIDKITGTILNQVPVYFENDCFFAIPMPVCKTSNSEFVFGMEGQNINDNNWSLMFTKMNKDLDILYTNYFYNDTLKTSATRFKMLANGNILISGNKSFYSPSFYSNLFFSEINHQTQNIIWDTIIDLPGSYHEWITDFEFLQDSSIIACGQYYANTTAPIKGFGAKFDSTFSLLWNKKYNLQYICGIDSAENNNILFCGSIFDSNDPISNDPRNKSCVLKTDMSGNINWTKKFGFPGSGAFIDIFYLQDNTYNIIGSTHETYYHNASGYMVKSDTSGNELWHRYYYADMNKDINTWTGFVSRADDNGFIFTGYLYDIYNFYNLPLNSFIIKVDSFGCDGWGSCDTALRVFTQCRSMYTNQILSIGDTICIGDRIEVKYVIEGGNDSTNYSVEIKEFFCDGYVSGDYPPPMGYCPLATFYNLMQNINYYYISNLMLPVTYQGNTYYNKSLLLRGKYDYGPYFSGDYDERTYPGGLGLFFVLDSTCVLDINKIEIDRIINISPNPANNVIIIDCEGRYCLKNYQETTYIINDNYGREVKQGFVYEFPCNINIEDLQDGMYVIILQNDNFYEKRKFVKQKR